MTSNKLEPGSLVTICEVSDRSSTLTWDSFGDRLDAATKDTLMLLAGRSTIGEPETPAD